MDETTLREDLEANFKDEGVEAPAPSVEAPVEAPSAAPEVATDGAAPAPSYLAEPTEKKPDEPQVKVEPTKAPEPKAEPQPSAPDPRAPQAWKPEARELFKSLPNPVRQEIVRRERDIARFVQETADARQHMDNFAEVCKPYSGMIALDGGDPMNTFKEYLKTGAILRLGGPVEKANAIATAVRTFGVDINALDSALAAQFGGQPQSQQSPQQEFRDPRLDQLIGHIQQTAAQRDEQLTRSQLSQIDEFRADPAREHFEDLRHDIADLLEFNARRGVKMTLAEAYDRAAQMHPQVSQILAQRRAAAAANQNRQLISQKRRLTTGAPGSPNLGTADNDAASLRQTLSAAFEAHSRSV